MQKQAPSLGRILVMVSFALSCFGLLLFLWLAFGGSIPLAPKGYRLNTSFGEATQLAKEADVRISGVSVGKVKTIDPGPTGRSKAVIEIDSKYAPLPKDSKAILRQKTLLGETYVELTPGTKRKGNMIPENGTLPGSQVSPTVELDEIFRAFPPKTREAFGTWMQTQAVAFKGRGKDLSDTLGNLAPFAQDTTILLQALKAQQADVRGVLNNTGTVFNALSARDGQLSSLISNSNTVFRTTAQRNADLQGLFRVLPTFEKESITTLNRLTRFSQSANPLITQLRPAARELSPTLIQLNGLAPDLKALFHDLNPLIDASKTGLPATERFIDELHPLLGELDSPLRQLNPILSFLGGYKQELNAFFSNTVAATEATDKPAKSANQVHYLRTTNPLNPEALAVYPNRIPSNRPNPYEFPQAFEKLGQGLPSFETRQCGNGSGPHLLDLNNVGQSLGGLTATLPPPLNNLGPAAITQLQQFVSPALMQQVFKFAFAGASGIVPAPPCKQQDKFTTPGGTSQYPHVVAAANGQSGKPAKRR